MHPACDAPWFRKIDSALRTPTHTVGLTAATGNGREAGRFRDAHQGNDGGSDSYGRGNGSGHRGARPVWSPTQHHVLNPIYVWVAL